MYDRYSFTAQRYLKGFAGGGNLRTLFTHIRQYEIHTNFCSYQLRARIVRQRAYPLSCIQWHAEAVYHDRQKGVGWASNAHHNSYSIT